MAIISDKATSSLVLPGGRWTAQELRRTAGTLMASLGISGDVIDECLNQMIESRVRRIYIRDHREADQARAFDALGAKLAELLGDDAAGSNVVPIRSAAASNHAANRRAPGSIRPTHR